MLEELIVSASSIPVEVTIKGTFLFLAMKAKQYPNVARVSRLVMLVDFLRKCFDRQDE